MAMKVQQGINSFLNNVYEKDEYRIRVSSEPAAPLAGNNPSYSFGYSGSNLVTITKTIGGTSYVKTLSYSGSNLSSVSSWVES